MPYLLPERKWKRAAKLEERGLLKKEAEVLPPTPGCGGYVVTKAGIEAYNAALTPNGGGNGPRQAQLAEGPR